MALVKWKDIYSVNVEEIDNQHKKLFDIINRLYGSLSTGDSRAELQLILDDLIDYADVHFKTEKKYFDKYNYSGSLSHKSEHLKFEKIVLQFKESFAMQALKFHYPIETFLFDWLMNHMTLQSKIQERVVCPNCSSESYTFSKEVYGPCPFCGFEFHWAIPNRRLSERTKIKEFITLELHNQILLKANVVDTSVKGVGVIFSNPAGVKKGDETMYIFGKKGKRGRAKVVWHDNAKGNERAGLLLN